jgi:hypothetical protein
MNSQTTLFITSLVLVPGVIALLLFGVFTYLYRQSRKTYFRAWQLGWAASVASYLLLGIHYSGHPSLALTFFSKVFVTAMVFAIFLSSRLIDGQLKWRWYDSLIVALSIGWQAWSAPFALHEQVPILALRTFTLTADPVIGLFALLTYSSWRFFALGRDRKSTRIPWRVCLLLGTAAALAPIQYADDEFGDEHRQLPRAAAADDDRLGDGDGALRE